MHMQNTLPHTVKRAEMNTNKSQDEKFPQCWIFGLNVGVGKMETQFWFSLCQFSIAVSQSQSENTSLCLSFHPISTFSSLAPMQNERWVERPGIMEEECSFLPLLLHSLPLSSSNSVLGPSFLTLPFSSDGHTVTVVSCHIWFYDISWFFFFLVNSWTDNVSW